MSNFTWATTESDLTVFEEYGIVEEIVYDQTTFADTKSTNEAQEEEIILKRKRLTVEPADGCYQFDLEQETSAPIQSDDESEINYAESLLVLDDDCLLNIFSLLELNDLVTMGMTCWRLKNVAEMIYRTKTEFNLSDLSSDLTIRNITNILEALGPFLTHFKASNFKFLTRNDLLLTAVAKYCQNLTALSLDGLKINYNIKNLGVLFKKLKKLNLKSSSVSEKHLSMWMKGSGGNQLEEISLSRIHEIKGWCLTHFKNLKVAILSHCNKIEPKFFISFIDQNTTLEDLNIICCNNLNLECIAAIASKLTSLKKLHLSNNYEGVIANNYLPLADLPSLVHLQVKINNYIIDNSFPIAAFLLKLSRKNNLKYLDISESEMTKDTIKVLEKMTKLKVLKVNYIRGFDDEMLKRISEIKDLEELEIKGGFGVTNEGLLDFVKNCKHIRRMNISSCINVTNSFILGLMNIVEGRPQILTLFVRDTEIQTTIYSDNLLKPSKFIEIIYGDTTNQDIIYKYLATNYSDMDESSDSGDEDQFFDHEDGYLRYL